VCYIRRRSKLVVSAPPYARAGAEHDPPARLKILVVALVELGDAIRQHRGEAAEVTEHFSKLTPADRKAVLAFLQSL